MRTSCKAFIGVSRSIYAATLVRWRPGLSVAVRMTMYIGTQPVRRTHRATEPKQMLQLRANLISIPTRILILNTTFAQATAAFSESGQVLSSVRLLILRATPLQLSGSDGDTCGELLAGKTILIVWITAATSTIGLCLFKTLLQF